ncbi:galactofuranose ABC transporter, permease protein YjfF [Cohnella thailandensis]|uniref:Sugar ABC transporter permease YjfF n=1 Tax=Cohnella thailandensis TaxID=557557 RepID=A0A841T2T4_9BACL|nr:galactofuranose ABC transporter, permease protein YjfF [Cohnella thailandensis]MBB6636370.1 sugar ABC transporter permease YjfF [Cohnella thailandensis]MBP1973660.1 simple sugar transport system permease protein [Cohnella thailandensis]
MFLNRKYVPVLVTLGLLAAMFAAGSLRYTGFFSMQVLYNLLIDNSFLLITAVGMTFVILSGGIDLSVGSVIALTTMVCASLVEQNGWPPAVVIPMVLAMGSLFGALMGAIIHYFRIQPFIVTLAGMFLARGLCYVISIDTITIADPFYTRVAQTKISLPGGFVSINVLIALVVVLLAVYLAHYTRFGRKVYAIGGSEHSSLLMGLPVARTKILVYTLSGFCSSLAGVVFTFYMLSGYGLHAMGLELDTIAAVVIGGTLLTGGVGFIAGTFLGVLIQGVIQTIISFEGTLSSWWTKIVIGLLLFVFILFQRVLSERRISIKS